jgi:hypothetical protein
VARPSIEAEHGADSHDQKHNCQRDQGGVHR